MPDLIEAVEDGIATLNLNRPMALNVLSVDIRIGFLDAPERLAVTMAWVALS